ncbi:MAG: GAF domain-containing protein [Bacteroidetes bacterium]|nr:GAF domain-containing protein [Bacteroidota bacterium]
MSLKRALKSHGFKDMMLMGLAIATSAKIASPPPPKNESLRRAKVAETGIIGQDLSSQFEIYGEVAKMITGADMAMVNILDGKNQFTIGGTGIPIDPLMQMPQNMSMCQFALSSSEPFIIPDFSQDSRFAGSYMTKPPINAAAYAGFPLNTSEGVALGTLCVFHKRPVQLDEEQKRMMRQLAKAVADQIEFRTTQANLTASRVGAMLGRFLQFAPKGGITDLIGFLDFCAHGTALPEILSQLERDDIVTAEDGNWRLTQNGSDLKAELGLASTGYRGSQVTAPSAGSQLDDLLEKMG